MLSSVIMSEDRLLRLYESGLPGWAVLLPRLGIYYRPWVRRVTWILFYIFSIVSLAAGFYDLYRNLPGVQVRMVPWKGGGVQALFLDMHNEINPLNPDPFPASPSRHCSTWWWHASGGPQSSSGGWKHMPR